MIFNFTESTRFYIFREPVDMRKGIHSLYHLVQKVKEMDVLSGDCFVFIGRTRKSLKVLRWHKEGFILYYKKLELGQYTLLHRVADQSFSEVESDAIDNIVNNVKHRSCPNALRQKAMLTI